ncbi:MAG: HNH endonuclease [bacterium]
MQSVRKEVTNRAGHKCELCGLDLLEEPNLLQIHHMDGNRDNNSPDNLMCLCFWCHALNFHPDKFDYMFNWMLDKSKI